MLIAVIAGGTLGHIKPALILAKELSKNNQVIFIATNNDKKYKLETMSYIYKVYYICAYGLSNNIYKLIKNMNNNLYSYKEIKKIVKQNKIDKAIGFGGYISGLFIRCCLNNHIDCYIHEQNSVMGRANRFVYKKCKKVFLSIPLINKKTNRNFMVIGNPVYDEAFNIKQQIYKERNTLLVTSGSLGSKFINDLIVEFLKKEESKKYSITIITGPKYYEKIKNEIQSNNVEILPYTSNLLAYLAKSEIVITRAGSSTLFEIAATRAIPIIIPSPNVVENHQYHNAVIFTKNTGILLEEGKITIDDLLSTILEIENNKERYLKGFDIFKYQNISKQIVKEICNE